jgi:hypothetical protein
VWLLCSQEEDDDDKNMTGSWDAVGGGGEGTKSIMGVKSLMTAAGFLGKIASRNKTKGEHGESGNYNLGVLCAHPVKG